MQQMIHECCMLLGKKFGSFDRGLRSIQFLSQLLLKLKEVNDESQHFYEQKQCQNNNWIHKMDRVTPTLTLNGSQQHCARNYEMKCKLTEPSGIVTFLM